MSHNGNNTERCGMQTVGTPFRVQFGVTNTKQFKIGSSGQDTCSICGDAGQFVICRARHYVR